MQPDGEDCTRSECGVRADPRVESWRPSRRLRDYMVVGRGCRAEFLEDVEHRLTIGRASSEVVRRLGGQSQTRA
eukprot:11187388-Lingulodinium_polyedra.AAC.1